MNPFILKNIKCDNFPRVVEFGIKRLFRIDVEISVTDRILRFGAIVKNPLTGKKHFFGFND